LKVRRNLLQLLQQFQAGAVSQREVEYCRIPVLFLCKFQRLGDGAGLAENGGFGLIVQDSPHAIPDYFMVVDE
jgi:hypothetical protein